MVSVVGSKFRPESSDIKDKCLHLFNLFHLVIFIQVPAADSCCVAGLQHCSTFRVFFFSPHSCSEITPKYKLSRVPACSLQLICTRYVSTCDL